MLKIKDNVDLKELEKFGFMYWENGCGTTGYSKYYVRGQITIIEKDKEFENKYIDERVIKENQIINDLDLLYDLIKAGLVEKVEDNNDR